MKNVYNFMPQFLKGFTDTETEIQVGQETSKITQPVIWKAAIFT